MADQEGRIAVVTGGGRGLGRAAAVGLASRGATVVAVARSQDQCDETASIAAASKTRGGGRVIPMTADVADIKTA